MTKKNAASLRGGGVFFCLGISFEARGLCGPAISVSLARGKCGRVVALLHCSSEPIAQIFENIFNIRGDLDEGRVERHYLDPRIL